MPQAQATQVIDWPGIRANSVTMGISAAARAAARDLPPDEQERFRERVAKRATREGWEEKRKSALATRPTRGPIAMPLSKNVQNGQESAANALAEDERETRASLSRSARRLARQSESADITLETPADVLAVAKLYAVTHRIDEKSGSQAAGPTLNVQFLLSEGVRVEKVCSTGGESTDV